MSVVSGMISFTRIIDGNIITSNLYSTKILVQRLKEGADTPMPNWEDKDSQPTIYPRVIAQSTGKRVTLHSHKWFHNGAEIKSTDNRFEITTHDDGGVVVPALRIVKNLAAPDNLDTDVVSFEAKTIVNGVEYEVKANIDIRLEEMVGEPYDGVIEATEGGVIDDDTPEITCTTILYKGGAIITEGVTYKWYRVTIDGQQELQPNPATPNKMKFKDEDINSELTIKVDFFYLGQMVYTVTRNLSDETDTLYLHVSITNGQDLRDGESSDLIPVVYNRVLNQKVQGYTFTYSLLDNMLEQIEKVTGDTYTMTAEKIGKHGDNINVIINATI